MHHGSTTIYHTIPLIMLVMNHRAAIYTIPLIMLVMNCRAAIYHAITLIMLLMYHRATIYHASPLIILAVYQVVQFEELPYYNKYCFTITPINYYGSGMQLICKLLSLYINFVLFIGGCVPGYNVKPPIISDTTFDS